MSMIEVQDCISQFRRSLYPKQRPYKKPQGNLIPQSQLATKIVYLLANRPSHELSHQYCRDKRGKESLKKKKRATLSLFLKLVSQILLCQGVNQVIVLTPRANNSIEAHKLAYPLAIRYNASRYLSCQCITNAGHYGVSLNYMCAWRAVQLPQIRVTQYLHC